MPDARMGHRLARVHVEIVAGRHLLRPGRLRVPEVDPDLRLVRALVRRESDIPVDARQRSAERLGLRDDVGADLLQPRSGVADELQARFLDGLLVSFLVLREPLFVVVLRQVAEEREEFRGEVRRLLAHPQALLPTGIASHRLNIGANGRASKTARTAPILSPRMWYHSQMNAVPAGVFVTMSYKRQTSSPSTNVFFGERLLRLDARDDMMQLSQCFQVRLRSVERLERTHERQIVAQVLSCARKVAFPQCVLIRQD